MSNKLYKTFRFKGLLQKTGWLENANVSVDEKGCIINISGEKDTGEAEFIDGYALPGFQNAHSHAFQYAMAGIAEHFSDQKADSFWGWREAMYKLALTINPEQMRSIATMVYTEMVTAGYTNVTEFHYLHHDISGKPYENLAEMGQSLIHAAQIAGINITLVPIFYQKGGFGMSANERQRRFISKGLDDYLNLVAASAAVCNQSDFANLGIGAHSMRAVEPELIVELSLKNDSGLSYHLHVSEQIQEVSDAVNYLGMRPVEWLLQHMDLKDNHHLVHATHLSDFEVENLGKSKANVVLCPSTEANLGDGIFRLRDFQDSGGNWSIGTDSHIGINPFEELRILDYGQRLISNNRHSFASELNKDPGLFAIEKMTLSGRKAMGNRSESFFEVGAALNACIIDGNAPLIAATSIDNLLSTVVYANLKVTDISTMIYGKIKSEKGLHNNQHRIRESFFKTIRELKNR